MGLLDWLYARKRDKENLDEYRRLQANREAVIASGNYSERDGLLVCPHCGYRLSQEDIEDNRRKGSGLPEGLGINPKDLFQCPACHRVLNY